MVQETIPEVSLTDAEKAVYKRFVDCANPVSFILQNTGSKVIRVKLLGGYDDTLADMVTIWATDGTTKNPDVASSGFIEIDQGDVPYPYLAVTAWCPAHAETSKCKGSINWKGHL